MNKATATAAVALFVASGLKVGMNDALRSLQEAGLEVDSVEMVKLVAEELLRPYDKDRHTAARENVLRMIDSLSAAGSDRMLAAAAAEPGATRLPSGMVIRTITPGTGASPTLSSTVAIRYTGLLPDGTVFDTIGNDEEPMQAVVFDLTAGMREGLPLMRAGGSYVLTMPAALGYGDDGIPGVIPPKSALRFEVELVDIIK